MSKIFVCVWLCDMYFFKYCVYMLFIHLQISDHFDANGPNNSCSTTLMVINGRHKDKSLNTTLIAHFVLIMSSLMRSQLQTILLFLGLFCHNNGVIQIHSYNRQRKAKVTSTGTKSPTKANTDHHNGDLKLKQITSKPHLNNVRKLHWNKHEF